MVFSDKLQAPELRFAVTVHSLKNPLDMHKVHHYYLHLDKKMSLILTERLNDTQALLVRFRRARQSGAIHHFNMAELGSDQVDPHLERFWEVHQEDSTGFDVLRDDFDPFNLYVWNSRLPRDDLTFSYRRSLKIALGKLMRHFASKKVHGNVLRFVRLSEGWRAYDPLRGHRLVCDSILSRTVNKGVVTRMERLQFLHLLQAPVLEPELEAPDANAKVHIVVPVAGEVFAARDFLKNFEEEVLKSKEQATLVVVLFVKTAEGRSKIKSAKLVSDDVDELRAKYPDGQVTVLHADQTQALSVSASLELAVSYIRRTTLGHDHLIFLASTGLVFRAEFFLRCRLNARAKTTTFFPIPFGLYHPTLSSLPGHDSQDLTVHKEYGEWAPKAYTAACFHDSDLTVLSLDHVDKEGGSWFFGQIATLMTKMVTIGFEVMRAPDPDLFLINRSPSTCNALHDNRTQCRALWMDLVGSASQLYAQLKSDGRLPPEQE